MQTTRPMIAAFAVALATSTLICAGSAAGATNAYSTSILVANRALYNPTAMIDPDLVNGWGIALRPPGAGGHIWLSNAGTGTTTTYIGDVNGIPLHQDGLKVIPIAAADGSYTPQVTGQVYNATSDIAGQPTEFYVSGPANNWSTSPPTAIGTVSGSAKFVFVTLEGTINAWRSGTNPGMQQAVVIKDFTGNWASDRGLRFAPTLTGVAMTTDPFTLDAHGQAQADNRLYATDFGNNRIMTFDNQWNDLSDQVTFERPATMDPDYSPFNIQNLDGRLYVAYAASDFELDAPSEPIRAPAAGRVVAYDREGHIVQDFADQLPLNAPWGLALAPESFGTYAGKLLVGNFGSGTIAAYDPDTGAFVGELRDASGKLIAIDGLWGLTFGNGVSLGDASVLYFAAGPNLEDDGVFGRIAVAAVPEPATALLLLLGGGVLLGIERVRKRDARR